ncbi:hypothetical protein FRC00_011110 [Tulasnella sp. 408]|nr:hypothetical protein FRC00_011110 [Tulasnella sp. 408]
MPSDSATAQLHSTFAPIGGFPSSFDIAPTITFIVLYGCLVPLCVFRISSPKSRNVVQLPIVAAIIERILNLSVRLLQATGKWPWTSAILLEYQQITLEWGWIALAHAMVAFWRSVAVNATRPDPEKGEGGDQKKMRQRIKKVTYAFDGSYWVAQLLGVGAAICWRISLHDGLSQGLKAQVDGLRYSAICLAMILILASAGGVLWTRNRMQGADQRACSYLVYLYLSILVVPTYRLTQYPSFSSSNTSKALFYVFHLTPEFLISAILVALNTRQLFQTGPRPPQTQATTEISDRRTQVLALEQQPL